MYQCDKCIHFGLHFERNYSPEEFFEGRNSSAIWIVGLNPKGPNGYNDNRDKSSFETYFDDKQKIHPYFNDFKKVDQKLYDLLGKHNGVGHTDIVKCFSEKFPSGKTEATVITNCRPYFENQLKQLHPKMIICNGKPVGEVVKELISPPDNVSTSYIGEYQGNKIIVILTHFVGRRLSNLQKANLGKLINSMFNF